MSNIFTNTLAAMLRYSQNPTAVKIRRKAYEIKGSIDANVYFSNPKSLFLGNDSWLYYGCYILNTNGELTIGDNSHLGVYCNVNVYEGMIKIGDHVAIGPGTKIIAYSNYYEKGKYITESTICQDIIIGNNVFIGANCTLLPGTIIEDHVIVGAGSVVKGTLNSNAIYAGSICKEIKKGWYH